MRKKVIPVAVVLLVTVVALPIEAGVGFRGTKGLIRTKSADTIGKGILNLQLSGQYYVYPDSLLRYGRYNFGDNIMEDAVVDYHFIITRAALTYGLNDYFEVAANVEIRNWVRNAKEKNGHDLDVRTRGGLGDTQVSGKLAFPIPIDQLKFGALGEVSFPTGNDERRFSTGEVEFAMYGLATLDFTDLDAFVPTRLHINAGYAWNRNEELGYGIFSSDFPDSSGFMPPAYPASVPGDDSFNDAFLFNTAIEFPAPKVTFFVEFDWKQLLNVEPLPANRSRNVLTLTPGVGIPTGGGFELEAAGDINLNSGGTPALVGAPDWGLWLTLSNGAAIVPQDIDGDGIPDKDDRCADQPEDIDGYEDSDGCPDLDNDGDGIPDADDQCPDLAEDNDGFEDGDGCPDLDNDQDGIPDESDRCPNEPEDFDGDQDHDGCPDLIKDSDADSIPDDLDRCPLQAEDVDGYQDDDGCPDLDNDLDGIPDAEDKCPNAPETFNGFEDEDGCPDERPIAQQFVLRGVNFESGSADLTPDSYRVLDDVVRSLMAYPEVQVEIQGFTDSVGKASANLALSQRRAEAVKKYLVTAGIDPARLVARGYGEANPVETNDTPEGRAQNRRIEFKRLN